VVDGPGDAPFALRELLLRPRALDRRRAHNRPPVREIAGPRLDPFRREVYQSITEVHDRPSPSLPGPAVASASGCDSPPHLRAGLSPGRRDG
jgi:hypothetical protein